VRRPGFRTYPAEATRHPILHAMPRGVLVGIARHGGIPETAAWDRYEHLAG